MLQLPLFQNAHQIPLHVLFIRMTIKLSYLILNRQIPNLSTHPAECRRNSQASPPRRSCLQSVPSLVSLSLLSQLPSSVFPFLRKSFSLSGHGCGTIPTAEFSSVSPSPGWVCGLRSRFRRGLTFHACWRARRRDHCYVCSMNLLSQMLPLLQHSSQGLQTEAMYYCVPNNSIYIVPKKS